MFRSLIKYFNAVTPIQLAILLVSTMFIHQVEEYSFKFPLWFSTFFNAQLSNHDYILINIISLLAMIMVTYYSISRNELLILGALGTLVFVNGIAHILLSIISFSYSPGTISGVLLLIPTGTVVFKKIMPRLSFQKRILAVILGIFTLVGIVFLANII